MACPLEEPSKKPETHLHHKDRTFLYPHVLPLSASPPALPIALGVPEVSLARKEWLRGCLPLPRSLSTYGCPADFGHIGVMKFSPWGKQGNTCYSKDIFFFFSHSIEHLLCPVGKVLCSEFGSRSAMKAAVG